MIDMDEAVSARYTDNQEGKVPVLSIRNISVGVDLDQGSRARILDGISLDLHPNEIVGIVGETGAGKTILARTLLNLLPSGLAVTSGDILLGDRTITSLDEKQLQSIRGKEIAFIGTNAKALLDPVRNIGAQICRVLQSHQKINDKDAWAAAISFLNRVGIVDAERRGKAFPHELSGGMAQRVVIAMALISQPSVLLADDATLGLDATVAIQVLDLIAERARQSNLSVIMIAHDINIIANYCDRIAIMRGGKIVELAKVTDFLSSPKSIYGKELLGVATTKAVSGPSIAQIDSGPDALVEVRNLVKTFAGKSPGSEVRAVDDVGFSIRKGETLALVGESGSGKTTVGRCLISLIPSTSGSFRFGGHELLNVPEGTFRTFRKRIQMVFQEPYVSLNPRWKVRDIVGEPIKMLENMSTKERLLRTHEVLEMVGLPSHYGNLYASQLSAGEQKRIGVARALSVDPEFIIFDEPTTALDIKVRANLINLILQLQADMGLTAMFITHDLNSVRALAHRVAVMHHGQIVEEGATVDIFESPVQEYTKTLLAAELIIEEA